MSLRYKGAVLSATPPTVNADGFGSAKGIWTMQQQYQYEGSGTWPSPFTPSYVEDVFSTYLYTGNGSTQTITNNIDLSTNGGLVWIKSRSNAYAGTLFDTARGIKYGIVPSSIAGQPSITGGNVDLYAFNSDGFSVGADNNFNVNTNSATFASWTFRKAKKFFDVVTYTGNGSSSNSISHNLGSTPGFIVIKRTDSTSNWFIYHRGSGTQFYTQAQLNSTDALSNMAGLGWTAPTSTTFAPHYIRDSAGNTANTNGATYVAYLFAHDAGGFGDNATDSVIKCGSYTGNGGNLTVDLGFEAQWVLIKRTDSTSPWTLMDSMRGMGFGPNNPKVLANTTAAEVNDFRVYSWANGFGFDNEGSPDVNNSGSTYVYIAIRRGPMKTPTDATKVFNTLAASSGNPQFKNVGFPVDLAIAKERVAGGWYWGDRLRGENYLKTENANAEASISGYLGLDYPNGAWDDIWNGYHGWMFRRAPKFMDIVSYKGTGANLNVTHSLGAVPELMIVKSREATRSWAVYNAADGNGNFMLLNSTQASGANSALWNSTTPTSSVFTVGTSTTVNTSGEKYIAYLFASLSGISKIGSVSISSSGTLNVDCGFTNGARFVMLKRSSDTSDWLIFDTVRGIVAGNDPYVAFNSTSAENFNGANDNIDPYSAGFSIPMSTFSNLYGTGTYIYLAIA